MYFDFEIGLNFFNLLMIFFTFREDSKVGSDGMEDPDWVMTIKDPPQGLSPAISPSSYAEPCTSPTRTTSASPPPVITSGSPHTKSPVRESNGPSYREINPSSPVSYL